MSSGRPARLRAWNAAAITLLIAYLAGLGLFCATALAWTAKPQRSIPPPFDDYAKQTEWWPIAVQLGVGLAAFFAYYIPRRHESRSFSLLITGGLGVTTLVLGAFSVWNCTELETPFFTPMAMALGLVLGNKPDFTGHCDESSFTAPLALQVARLSGPLLLVITALGIVTALFRTQLDRLIVRFSRALVVVIGLSEEAIPLLKRLAENLPRGTTLAVLIENSDDPLTKQARTLGARVVVCNLDKDSAIRVLVLRQNRFKVDALYVVSTDVPANLAWAKQFREIADASRTDSHDPPPRIIARIDDPWQAEYWRRTNAYRTPTGGRVESVRWVPDALSIYEVTATMLVTHVQSTPHDRLVVVGRSPLALAICAELAQREREGAVLRTKPEPSLNELVLVGLEADKLREQHQIRQERFGNAAEAAHIDVDLTSPTEPALATLLAGYEHPAVIFADDLVGARKDDLSATLLAALHPNWTIYHSDSATVGLADRPIMERLFPFGLTIEPKEGTALDSWERAARVVHQKYLDDMGAALDPSKPAQRPWAQLSGFYRASNVRLVTATLAGAESIGRTWGPTPKDPRAQVTGGIDPDQLIALSRFEHESWLRFYVDAGWKYRPERNDARHKHNGLVRWGLLTDGYKERTRGNVTSALNTLRALGYRSWTDSDRPWASFERRGEVTATVLTEDWRWQTRSGDWMTAHAGDYRVSNGQGNAWSVESSIFKKSYAHVEGDRWRRTGRVWAQPALEGELVITLEGPAFAKPGDWMMKGAAGEQWLTPAGHFAENYAPVSESMAGAASLP